MKICTVLQRTFISHLNFDDIDEYNPELKEFIQSKRDSTTLAEIRNDIENTEVKNIIKNTSYKIPRFNLKLYAFVYNKLLEFLNQILLVTQLPHTIFLKIYTEFLK